MTDGDSAFWRFSLRFYARPEIPPLCIALQDDYGIDVNLLFFILFLSINQRRLTADEVHRIDAAIQGWRANVVQPLRAVRRNLKGGIAPVTATDAETLRSAIKRDELAAERIQQETLEREFPAHSTGTIAAPREAAAANIAAYGSATSPLPTAAVATLLSALTEEFSG